MRHMLQALAGLTLLAALAAPPQAIHARAAEAAPPSSLQVDDPVLSAAHPNPFRAYTTFTLQVPSTQQVRISLFNMLGQRVRLLYEGPVMAGEPHSFTIEAGTLPSGLYLYRAQGEHFEATRRVTLVR